jgi:hypothetical protein
MKSKLSLSQNMALEKLSTKVFKTTEEMFAYSRKTTLESLVKLGLVERCVRDNLPAYRKI